MWVLKLRIKHDCTIGSRCERFKCISFSLTVSNWIDGRYHYTSQRHTIEGKSTDIQRFLEDLKRDLRITNIEISKNTVFFVEKRRRGEIPSSHYNERMFFVKPVFVDRKGFEYWEMAS